MPSTAVRITPAAYLEREREAETKSEYYDGEVVAMAGAGVRHGFMLTNIILALGSQLKSKKCGVILYDLRTAIKTANAYVYPDVVVICGKPAVLDKHRDTITNPVILFEVLSPATRKNDRGRKLAAYQTIPSLRHYLIVSQDRVLVEHWSRADEAGEWSRTEMSDSAATIALDPPGASLPIAAIYDGIDLGE